MRRTTRFLAVSTALAAALVLSSCGTGSDSSAGDHKMSGGADMKSGDMKTSAPSAAGTTATGAKNPADIAFATGMIPHHVQAVAMADMAPQHATSPKVKALAVRITAAQGPEIAQMSGWLKGWGSPVPGTGGGHDMSSMGGQNGMMSTQQMTDLGKANGVAFDSMWLTAMTEHHQGAVAMAKTELAKGVNPDSKKLAQAIINGQTAEIAEMKAILAGIPG